MLFYSWRDEESDLLECCKTYKEKYEMISEKIEEERQIF